MTRAKFRCDKNENGGIVLNAVTSGSDENKGFFEATPSGSIQMGIVNKDAAAQFVPGQEYYVDFSEAKAAVNESEEKSTTSEAAGEVADQKQ